MNGCTAPPWIGPGPDERDLDRQVIEVLGRVRRSDCICARLSIWKTPTVSALWISRVDDLVLERDPRQVDRLAMQVRDLLDAVLDRREHPQPEQVDLQEACVGARVLVPLADLPPFHRGRLHRDELDERPCRDHHPARMLREVPRQAADLAAQLGEGPAIAARRSFASPSGSFASSSRTRRGLPSVSRASRSSSSEGRPSALPTSRIAPRAR